MNKIYKVHGVELTQDKLTVGQAHQIKQLFADIGITNLEDISTAVDKLVETDRLDDFVKIFVKGDFPENTPLKDWLYADTSLEMVADFFTLNDSFIKGFVLFLNSVAESKSKEKKQS